MEEDFLQSKLFKEIVLGIGLFAVLVLAFSLGIFVGEERADFSFQWAGDYHRNFGDFINHTNGVFGEIIKIEINDQGSSLTIKSNDNIEGMILTNSKTIIRSQRKIVKTSDLKIGDNIIVIGNPNSLGQIEAEFIRVMPQQPQMPVQKTQPVQSN